MSLAISVVVLAGVAAVVLAIRAARHRVALASAVAALAVTAVLGAVHPTSIGGYREIDYGFIQLQVLGASPVWRGVTQRAETGSTVTVGVSEISKFQLGAGFGDEQIGYVEIRLDLPVGNRQIIDAATGAAIPRINQ
jgi:hypothetical protein